MAEMRYCSKCRKTMADTNYYTYKDGSKCELCKSCLTMHINNFDPETFLWLLEKFDVPYIPAEWNVLRDRAYQKDPYKMNGMSVFGKYLSKMKLKQWKNFTWADSKRLQVEAEEKAKLYGQPQEIREEQLKQMEEAFHNGEISEAQWMTYKAISEPEKEFKVVEGNTITTTKDAGGGYYPVNENPFEQVDIPDVGSDLTQEDKIYLAMKWGRLYSAADWVYLEQKYKDFMESFDIQGAARIDTLIQICKLSLKLNQAIDTGDTDSYSKYARSYDSLMKSAKFTEAQRKEEKSGEFDSVGQIVYFAEKYGGKIPRFDILEYYDGIDEKMENLKRYNRDLIMNDTSLAQMIENYITRRTAAENQKQDLKEAKEKGMDYVEIKDEDYKEFYELIEKDKEADENDES